MLSAQKSTKGTRNYSEPPDGRTQEAFDQRVCALLNRDLPVDASGNDKGLLMRLEPPVMHLEPAAKAIWVEFHDAVEREMHQFGEFASVSDVASKSAENAVRIASVFQIFERGKPSPHLARDYVKAGIALAGWHLREARRIFFEADMPEADADARMLSDWLRDDAWRIVGANGEPIMQGNRIPSKMILQYGPYRLRDRERRDRALDKLGDDEVQHAILATKKRRKVVWINPNLLN